MLSPAAGTAPEIQLNRVHLPHSEAEECHKLSTVASCLLVNQIKEAEKQEP